MEWNNEIILEFIQLYEKYPVLWDPKHPNHKNRNTLNDAWLNIAATLSINTTVDILRKKKESLMATYRTLSRKVRISETTGSGAKDVYSPSWFAYDAIDRFIRVTGKKTPSLSSEEAQIEDTVEDESSQNTQEALNEEEEHIQDNQAISKNKEIEGSNNNNPKRQNFILPQNKLKLTSNPIEAHLTKHIKQASDALTTLTTRSHTPPDELGLYGQLLAAKLRRLPKRTQVILQNKIDNLLFETELNEIDSSNGVIGRSHASTTNFNSPCYGSPAPTPSPSNSYLYSSPDYVSSSPGPSYTVAETVTSNVNSQESTGSLLTYYSNANDILDISKNVKLV